MPPTDRRKSRRMIVGRGTKSGQSDADSAAAPKEDPELDGDADAPADGRGDRRAGDAEFRKWSETEDQTGVENDVADVGDPQHPHGDGGVSGAAEDRVEQEDQHDGRRSAEEDLCVAVTRSDQFRAAAHQRSRSLANRTPGRATTQGQQQTENDRLRGGDAGARRCRFSPIRRATIAVVAIPVPTATAKRMVIMASVRPTVATASVPRRETKKASVRAKTDSMTISSTIGIASRTMARPIGPDVKSSSLPVRASFTVAQAPAWGANPCSGSASDRLAP